MIPCTHPGLYGGAEISVRIPSKTRRRREKLEASHHLDRMVFAGTGDGNIGGVGKVESIVVMGWDGSRGRAPDGMGCYS